MMIDWPLLTRGSVLAVCLSTGIAFAAVPEPAASPLAGTRIIELTVDDVDLLHLVLDEGLRPLACRPGPGTSNWLANDTQVDFVHRIGMPVRVLVEDVDAHVEAERRANEAARGGDWYASYHELPEFNARLDGLAATYPDLVHGYIVGQSHDGRDIKGIRIGTGDEGVKPAVLFNGCQHAREWVATMVPMYIADELAAGYGVDSRITGLLQLVDVYIVPIVNPDGYEYTYAAGGDRFWRKNRRDNGTGCDGVDLNRNWGVDWNGGESTSNNTCSDVYVGPSVFSEPESAAMRDFILDRPNIASHIDFHSYAEVILQPWGYTNVLPPDHDEIDALGEDMSQAILGVHGTYYPHGGGGDLLYLASGVFPDWTYGEAGAFGYTIELRGNGFDLPASQIRPTCEENLEAALAMMEWAGIPLDVTYPDGLPTFLHTEDETSFEVVVSAGGDLPDLDSATIAWRLDGGTFSSAPLSDLGGGTYMATLPSADCDDQPEYYLEFELSPGNAIRDPLTAPENLYSTGVITELDVSFQDDGESDPGWTVSGDAGDGHWTRGVPAGGGDRGDPPNDGDGSGSCWLTDNVDGNSDIDNGTTILTSPPLDTTGDSWIVSYERWYSNDFGAAPNADIFVVEVSDDGVDWIVIETVGPSGPEASGGWYTASFELDDVAGLEPSTEFRIRFIASDLDEGSVVEAGVDAILLQRFTCESGGCPADCAGDDGLVNVEDLLAVIAAWGSSDESCDIDGSGTVNVADLLLVIAAWGPCQG